MPGKSRRRKGKYSIQNRRQGRTGRLEPIVQSPVAGQAHEPVPLSAVSASSRVTPASSVRRTATAVKPAAGRDLYVASELRTIGILAGIMLILLVVLARVLA